MQILKRVSLFLALNFTIILSISALCSLFGLNGYLTAKGLNYQNLAALCLLWGMGGAFISLALSRVMAKWTMGVKLVPLTTQDPKLQQLRQTVQELSHGAGLNTMPEVGIYESSEINAFATGPSRSRSLVAVSSGLLQHMDRKEVRGVLAHEIAHIANGDMVTMTLLQGVVNAFVMFLARLLTYAISQFFRGDDEESGLTEGSLAYFAVQMALEIVFMILGSMIVARFSRWREYRADAGGARLGGRENMIAALEGLRRNMHIDASDRSTAIQMLKIEGSQNRGLMRFFASHPSLEERIARLQKAPIS